MEDDMRSQESSTPDLICHQSTSAQETPRALIAGKRHVRDCLGSTLAQFGFDVRAYDEDDDLAAALSDFRPDVLLMWVCPDNKTESASIIRRAAREGYKGEVLLLGAERCPFLARAQALGQKLGLATLTPLSTPIGDKQLWFALRDLCDESLTFPKIDLLAAIKSKWVEVWYQPKFDCQTFSVIGAEALVRMRHPKWGIIEPNHFIPRADEDDLTALSEFVVSKAMSDWHHFAVDYDGLELAVNIPLAVLTRSVCMQHVIEKLPQDGRFYRALIEADAAEVIENPGLAKSVASELTHHHLALSVDDVAEDWIELCAVQDAPLAEIKVDRSVVAGCAKNEKKRAVCNRIIEYARRIGVRTVAEGVETKPDLLAVRELGFDLVQGYLCGRPMERMRFSSLLRKRWCASRQYARVA
jgi:EAL domain-containing protein (putative c-di-GMP-specific phosphodiesterase class I)